MSTLPLIDRLCQVAIPTYLSPKKTISEPQPFSLDPRYLWSCVAQTYIFEFVAHDGLNALETA